MNPPEALQIMPEGACCSLNRIEIRFFVTALLRIITRIIKFIKNTLSYTNLHFTNSLRLPLLVQVSSVNAYCPSYSSNASTLSGFTICVS